MSDSGSSVERLALALADERDALIGGDADSLLRATREKLAALHALETDIDPGLAGRIAELAELNRANGALLARRRREVNWALRRLGRTESAPAYDASGGVEQVLNTRQLAVA